MNRRTLAWIFTVAASVLLGIFVWGQFFAKPLAIPIDVTSTKGMVAVPGGRYLGTEIAPFYIDRYEVTEADWALFARATGRRDPLLGKKERRAPDYPIRHISLTEAEAYASWRGVRLPTNLEWDRASRGQGDGLFPWGEGYLPLANTAEAWENRGFAGHGVVRVGIFARGRSAVGAQDMIGNVREWTCSSFFEALRNPRAIRFAAEPDFDLEKGRLVSLKHRLEDRPEPFVLHEWKTPIDSLRELQPDPELTREARLGLIDILPVLTPSEELDFRRQTGFELRRDEQFVMDWLVAEEVALDDLVEDLLVYEAPDPRLLPVLGPFEVGLLEEAGEGPRGEQHALDPRTLIGRDELMTLFGTENRGASLELEIEPSLELFPVLDASEERQLESRRRDIDRALESISEWREEFAEFIRLRQASFAGERHVVVRGGSFRTRIKGTAVVLEEIENAGNASWDLGFRCVIGEEELERQRRLIPLIRDLGFTDPWNAWRRAAPARRALVAAGAEALPYLRRARAEASHPEAIARLDAVIRAIPVAENPR
jgi:sulfatase-modifying factor enzyme 1